MRQRHDNPMYPQRGQTLRGEQRQCHNHHPGERCDMKAGAGGMEVAVTQTHTCSHGADVDRQPQTRVWDLEGRMDRI